ncbi:Dihydrofolate reductase [Streptomyces sp. 1222.5]|uniref:dihydrofolate reductase family protein n=1 Tax=unclassified Streptomyces TaxID=2593676 RepID=UPI0008941D39|nr:MULTISPECIES: dihydrofolate reductase family protein [unclassified Streptomyces]PKW00263.1 dihydrofolate reductase [Streptomyces sp. 5112.2]SED84426.1 Dihydrofolate reductase [Streptomyces sp. 1222.5]
MRKIVAGLFSSLDGVVEAPETWSMPFSTAETGAAVLRLFEDADTALLGRGTYEQWSAFFPYATNEQVPTAEWMNSSPKYVVSSSLTSVEEWKNSRLVTGDDVDGQIRALKEQPGGTINVGGSITLVQWLMRNGLLDELYLQINPIVVGTGRTLADGDQIPMTLASSRTFTNGVIEAHYTLRTR